MATTATHFSDSKYERVENLKLYIKKLKEMRNLADERLQTIKKGDTSEVKTQLNQVDFKLSVLEKRFECYINGNSLYLKAK